MFSTESVDNSVNKIFDSMRKQENLAFPVKLINF
jgi:hypothetical protein